jgi:RNA polymerase sigma-70 factor (ECF subfamily)
MGHLKIAPRTATADDAATDEQLVSRICAGESACFEALMRRHNQRLYRAARAIVKDEAEAEDVMQQAYVNAYTHLGGFEGRASFATWLTRIAVHEALARVSRRSRMTEIDAMSEKDELPRPLLSRAPDPEQRAMAAEVGALLEAAVDSLPQPYRAVFVLREIEELDTAETAACLELSEEAVRTRLYRARALLREELLERAGLASAQAFRFERIRCDRVVAAVSARLGR